MKVIDYLRAKYGTERPTTMLWCEQKVFGIPRLENGWLARYGQTELTLDMVAALRAALLESTKPTAKDGLRVLDAAHIQLKTQPSATGPDFLQSKSWKRLRLQALNLHGRRCQVCGASPQTGAVLNVDHVMPRRLFPHLALDINNLQVLCADCNEGKGNWDMTDARPKTTSR